MVRTSHSYRDVTFRIVVLIFVMGPSFASGATRRFDNKLFGYSLSYPADWYLHSLSGVLNIESFPPSKAVRGVRLPHGGTGIVIRVSSRDNTKEGMPQTLGDWIEVGTSHQKISRRREFELERRVGTISITEVHADCCGTPPLLEYTEWFFSLDGHFFQASLVRWQGDPNADKLQETLKQVVLSLKVKH